MQHAFLFGLADLKDHAAGRIRALFSALIQYQAADMLPAVAFARSGSARSPRSEAPPFSREVQGLGPQIGFRCSQA
jgi:hypothetical protein